MHFLAAEEKCIGCSPPDSENSLQHRRFDRILEPLRGLFGGPIRGVRRARTTAPTENASVRLAPAGPPRRPVPGAAAGRLPEPFDIRPVDPQLRRGLADHVRVTLRAAAASDEVTHEELAAKFWS